MEWGRRDRASATAGRPPGRQHDPTAEAHPTADEAVDRIGDVRGYLRRSRFPAPIAAVAVLGNGESYY